MEEPEVLKRTKTFEGKGRKIGIVSTPTSRTGSRINQWQLAIRELHHAVTKDKAWLFFARMGINKALHD